MARVAKTLLIPVLFCLSSEVRGVDLRCVRPILVKAVTAPVKGTVKGIGWLIYRKDAELAHLTRPLGGTFAQTAVHHRNFFLDWLSPTFWLQQPSRRITWMHNLLTKRKLFSEADLARILETIESLEGVRTVDLEVAAMSRASMDFLQLEFFGMGRTSVSEKLKKMLITLTTTPPEHQLSLLNKYLRKMPRTTYDFTPFKGMVRRWTPKRFSDWVHTRTLRMPSRMVVDGTWISLVMMPAAAAIGVWRTSLAVNRAKQETKSDWRFKDLTAEELKEALIARALYFEFSHARNQEMLETEPGKLLAQKRKDLAALNRLYVTQQASVAGAPSPALTDLGRRLKTLRDELAPMEREFTVYKTQLVLQEALGVQVPDLPDLIEDPTGTLGKPWDDSDRILAELIAKPYDPLFKPFRDRFLGGSTGLVGNNSSLRVDPIPTVLFEADYHGPTGPEYFEMLRTRIYDLAIEEMALVDEHLVISTLPDAATPEAFLAALEHSKQTAGPDYERIVEGLSKSRIWKEKVPLITKDHIQDLKNALYEYRAKIRAHRQLRILNAVEFTGSVPADPNAELAIEDAILRRN